MTRSLASTVPCVRLAVVVLLTLIGHRAHAGVIDPFDDVGAWSLVEADGVKGRIVGVDGALRLDYDFSAGAGYCIVRRAVDLPLDPNYRFGLRFRGTGQNTLEFKLVDPSGENVWWSVRRDIEFPADWTQLPMRKRNISFAWGPSGGQPLERVGAIEIAVTASKGGKGSVWLDDLVYERLPDVEPRPVEPHATTGDGRDLGRVGPDGSVDWTGDTGDTLDLTFDAPVEFGAVELEWAGDAPGRYRVEAGASGGPSRTLGVIAGSPGATGTLFTPETETRAVRIRVEEGSGRLRGVRFVPVGDMPDANAYFAWLAGKARRGAYPRYFGALSPWTVIGLPGHDAEALVSATGAIEPVKGGYSLEPFVVEGGRVMTWAEADCAQSLEDGCLPIPSVRWTLDGLSLDVTAVATGGDRGDVVLARYRLMNTGDGTRSVSLALAARAFQVLPAAQFLNTVGGAVTAGEIRADAAGVRVDGRDFARVLTPAHWVLAVDASGGSLVDRLTHPSGRAGEAASTGQFPSAALLYDVELTPGASREVVVEMPMAGDGSAGTHDFPAALAAERARWSTLVERTDILVPPEGQPLRETLRANQAYVLINADGPGIQPGSRSYERSWIRDGAMTSAALIATGHADEARAFIDWYAGYQYPDGKIPCVVDTRGPDPVDENDAPGQFLFAVRNSAESGGVFDAEFARAMYPKVRATIGYVERMRAKRLTSDYVVSPDPIRRACEGLMPESISHEGYSAKPMHSYWDDFWVYRGLRDAAEIADRLGEREDANRFAILAEEFGRSIRASVKLSVTTHAIDYVPGCVELGDFDATSTAIAYYPTGAANLLEPPLLRSTFERAWQFVDGRIKGGAWDGMTPYEVRVVGTFVRLGWGDRAMAYLDWLMGLQSPVGWRQWGEIAYHEDEPCRFVGDMPHTWVGSGAILSILSLFAYEDGDMVVLAGGIPAVWLDAGEPVGLRGRVTRSGVLSYTLRRDGKALLIDVEPGHEPPDGYRIDVGRLLAGAKSVEADGVSVRINPAGTVRLPPGVRHAVVR